MSEVVGASAPETPSGTQIEIAGNDYQKEIERLKAERKAANDEAAKYRVELKAKADAELLAQGKLEELNGNLKKDLEEIAAQKAAFEIENATMKERLSAIETARKNELLAKLPEALRPNYGNLEIAVLEQITKDFAQTVVTPTGNSQGNDRGNGTPVPNVPAVPSVPFAGGDSAVINKLTQMLQRN